MPDRIVPTTWTEQETLYYCGPAVAEMSLDALRVAKPAVPPSWQDQLWQEIQDQTGANRPAEAGPGSPSNPAYPTQLCEQCPGSDDWSCWSTTPTALERVLNLYSAADFAVSRHPSESHATAVLMQTLDQQLPAIALIYGWMHWVVVYGYQHDEADACIVDGRQFNGVYIHNPQTAASVNLVPCVTWWDDYLRFAPCGEYQDSIVVIGGQAAGGELAPTPAPPAPPTGVRVVDRGPKYRRRRSTSPGALIVPPDKAADDAQTHAERLQRSAIWKVPFSGARQEYPLLVQRLDRDDSFYYLVSYTAGGQVTARLIVDAVTTRLIEAAGIERPGQSLPPYVDPASLVSRWAGETIELPSLRRRVIRPGLVGEHPVLVWRPCRESTSPFLPFYLRSIGDEFVYIRVDGKRFTRLTTGPV